MNKSGDEQTAELPQITLHTLIFRRYLMERRRALKTELVEVERTLMQMAEMQEAGKVAAE